jgi:hypothetical protein
MSDWSRNDELLERLARQNPAPTQEFDGAELSVAAIDAFYAIVRVRRRLPWWKRRRIVIPLVVAVVTAATAAGYALSRPVTNTVTVGCYQAASLDAPLQVVPLLRSPIETCATLWASGQLGSPPHSPLVECVLASGAAVVFPTDDSLICSGLGLAEPAPTTITVPAGTLSQMLGASERASCLSAARGVAVAKQALTKLGLSHWRIETSGQFSSTEPCASFYVDVQHKVVVMVPEE